MRAFTICEGVAAPLLRDNIDTDLIVRIERIAQLKRGQFARWAFESWRYLPDGDENKDFVLNQVGFREAQIMLAGANFGCGSSREMAVWALDEFGIRCIIAQSFGDIFFNNCLQNGVLAVTLDKASIDLLATAAVAGGRVRVDLQGCIVSAEGVAPISFIFPEAQRDALLAGLDEIDQTLRLAAEIERFQQHDRQARPWIHFSGDPVARDFST
jgi:3-isopropylmalate/(R)-2-methylmalate dehydratase small subunit